MRRTTASLFVAVLALTGGLTGGSVSAQTVPNQCDFVTGGGFILRDTGAHGNFGVGGGCKNGGFWGHLNYLDHGTTPPFHVDGTGVTGYFFIDSMTRDISGTAKTNNPSHPNVNYCVEVSDNDAPGGNDTFVIQLKDQSGGVVFYTTQTDSSHTLHGGNIELHKPNPSTTGSFSSGSCLVAACPAGQTACGTSCTNTATDPANCGSCGHACAAGQSCTNGACACPAGQTACGTSCTNTATDPANCGGCGLACTPGAVCLRGICQIF